MSDAQALRQLAELLRLAAASVRTLQRRDGDGCDHLREANDAILVAAQALDSASQLREGAAIFN